MMREIKVRYIFKHVDSGNTETKIYSLSQLEERNVKELSPCFSIGYGYELMSRDEFTGLTDRDGKEIYEGDIVKGGRLRCSDGTSIHTDKVAVVFEDGIFKAGSISLISINRQTEVIGNIYEDSYLLDGVTMCS
jgi:uncharacterized phage protein (TIGR01671 family)